MPHTAHPVIRDNGVRRVVKAIGMRTEIITTLPTVMISSCSVTKEKKIFEVYRPLKKHIRCVPSLDGLSSFES